jgi:hypothetical protein
MEAVSASETRETVRGGCASDFWTCTETIIPIHCIPFVILLINYRGAHLGRLPTA